MSGVFSSPEFWQDALFFIAMCAAQFAAGAICQRQINRENEPARIAELKRLGEALCAGWEAEDDDVPELMDAAVEAWRAMHPRGKELAQ